MPRQRYSLVTVDLVSGHLVRGQASTPCGTLLGPINVHRAGFVVMIRTVHAGNLTSVCLDRPCRKGCPITVCKIDIRAHEFGEEVSVSKR
jgi:hypothetical protein